MIFFNLDNSNREKTAINFTEIATSNKTAVKALLLVTISIPEDENDSVYRKIIFKNSFDLCRFAKIQSTFIARSIMENFGQSANHTKVGEIPIDTVESDGTFFRNYYQSISCHTISESSFSVLQHFNITEDSKILL
jgi:hypothetical protein